MNKVKHRPGESSYFREWFQASYGRAPEEYEGPDDTPPPIEETPTPAAPPRKLRKRIEKIARRQSRTTKATKKKGRRKNGRAEHRRRAAKYYARAKAQALTALAKLGIFTDWAMVIPREVWVMAWSILRDRTGAAGRWYLARCRNKSAAGAIRKAAFEGSKRTWASLRARRIVVMGLAEHALSQPTQRRGRWRRQVCGVTEEQWCALLTDPADGSRPSINAVAGKHRYGGHYSNGQVGFLWALRQAGFHTYQQLPPDQVRPWERIRTPRGVYAINRYWLLSNNPLDCENPEHRRQILELAESELAQVEEEELAQVEGSQVEPHQVELAQVEECSSRAPPA